MGIFFSPMPGLKLVNWSFENGKILDGPIWKDNRPTYFIFYSHGSSPKPWEFWIELQVMHNLNIIFSSFLSSCSILGA